MHELEITIDRLTCCLRNRITNEIVKTEYCKATVFDLHELRKKGWKFDWTEPFKTGFEVFKLHVKGEKDIQGLIALKADPRSKAIKIDIVESSPTNFGRVGKYEGVGAHLFAIAAKISIENGFGGYTYFIAKSTVIDHYKKELGAVMVNPRLRIMAIEDAAALVLVGKYFKE